MLTATLPSGTVRVSQSSTAQVFQPQNTLRLKLGGRIGGIDPAAVAKAEAALKSLSGQFSAWLQDELDKLGAARAAVAAEGWTAGTAETLYLRAHDLKGLGATYEFPIVTRLAASLCRLLDEPATRLAAPMPLVDAHIDAIKAAVRDGIRDADHPVGRAIVTELEARVAALG